MGEEIENLTQQVAEQAAGRRAAVALPLLEKAVRCVELDAGD